MLTCDEVVGGASDSSRDDRQPIAHSLHDRQWKALGEVRRQDEEIGSAICLLKLRAADVAQEIDGVIQVERSYAVYEVLACWTGAGHKESTRLVPANNGEGVE